MYEKFMDLKENKKWLFYLLIPIFLFVAGLEFYNRYLINSGKQAVKDAEKEDDKLKEKQNKAEAIADHHKEEADKIEEQINNIKVDKDWHLK